MAQDATVARRGHDEAWHLERIERLRPLDDTFMRAMFRGQPRLVEHVVGVITGIPGLRVVEDHTQYDLKMVGGARSVALDVMAKDAEGTLYDLEVQTGSDLEPFRFRYYGSCMDVDFLGAGEDYDTLPERWVIVVLEHDPDGPGRRMRHYLYRDEDGEVLGDGTHVLYANASWRGEDDYGRLMSDFCESDPDRMRDAMVRERVQYMKRDPEGVREMCKVSEEIYNEGRLEGKAEGRLEGRETTTLESVRALMQTVGWTARQALERLRVPEAEWPHYLGML